MTLTTPVPARRPRRSLPALLVTAGVLAATLVATPAASDTASAATTNASQAAAIVTKLNSYRAKGGLGTLKTYAVLSDFAQDVSAYYATNKSIDGLAPSDVGIIPAYGYTSTLMNYRFKGTPQSGMPAVAAAKLIDESGDGIQVNDADYTHIGVGYTVKSGYTYVFAFFTEIRAKLQSAVIPKISGTAAVGKTISATVSGWGPSGVTFDYTWFTDDGYLDSGKSLKLTPELRGTSITLVVSGTKDGYERVSEYALPVTVGYGTLNAKTPTVTGSRTVRQTLTAVPGNWGSGVTFSYQWLRDGTAISGATDATYTQTATDRNKKITVKVVGKAVAYKATTKYSAASATTAGAFVPAQATLRGSSDVGETLTAVRGTWTPAPTAWEYRWFRDGARIAGVSGNTYVVSAVDAGHDITVTIVGSKPGYRNGSSTSAPVSVGALG